MGSAQRSARPHGIRRFRQVCGSRSSSGARRPILLGHEPPRRPPLDVRRVTLPTGQAIDVLYVEAPSARRGRAEHRPRRGLHVCPECASPLVAPGRVGAGRPHEWAVTIQCPNCEWWDADVFDEATVERFDEELDRGTEALVRDLLRLMRANMEDDVERFVAALRADAILPEDF